MKKLLLLIIMSVLLLTLNGCKEEEEKRKDYNAAVAKEETEKVKDSSRSAAQTINISDIKEITIRDETEKGATEEKVMRESLMDIGSWSKVHSGNWEKTGEGIKYYGAGPRLGQQGIMSNQHYNFVDSESFIKWKPDGGPGYASFWVFIMSGYNSATGGSTGAAAGGGFSTDHSYKESYVLADNTWYYTRIKVAEDSSYTAVTATGNYDSNGGSTIKTNTGTFKGASDGIFLIGFNDNYGGEKASVTVGEAKTLGYSLK